MTTSDAPTGNSAERADLLESLRRHRFFLRNTVRDLDDAQATQRTTVSELTLAGLIKHVTGTERQWRLFIEQGPSAMGAFNDPERMTAWLDGFRMVDGETLQGLLDGYARVAAETDELVATVDLNARQPLPSAPWFEPGASWSARRVLLHLIAETSQHAGHADIIRESLDGAKSMG